MTVMWWHDGIGAAMGWGGWMLMAAVMLVFWGAVIAGPAALFGAVSTTERPGRRVESDGCRARMILDERFARGDIGAEEYRSRSAELDHWR
jgi:putative membrane protein